MQLSGANICPLKANPPPRGREALESRQQCKSKVGKRNQLVRRLLTISSGDSPDILYFSFNYKPPGTRKEYQVTTNQFPPVYVSDLSNIYLNTQRFKGSLSNYNATPSSHSCPSIAAG